MGRLDERDARVQRRWRDGNRGSSGRYERHGPQHAGAVSLDSAAGGLTSEEKKKPRRKDSLRLFFVGWYNENVETTALLIFICIIGAIFVAAVGLKIRMSR